VRRGSPFHSRTSPLCETWDWRGWSGYLAASSYSLVPEMEYYAIRHSAGLIDVSPLYKYSIRGKDAQPLVNKVVTRDARKLAKGHIYYTPWCDERGKTVDDGTLWNFGDGTFRMTSAEPNLKWLQDAGIGLDAEVRDVSEELGALALQGPSSRAILREGADGAVQKLRYFRFVNTTFAGIPVQVSRTGYTGDLGYEIWVERERAEALWDALMDKGRGHDITPAGMLALDTARIEAGLILAEVEYVPARKAVIDAQRYSPFELSLDWTVALEKGPFIGRKALREERQRGPARRTVGLVIDWRKIERYYQDVGLPPQPPARPWRSKVPLYVGYRQVGWATSGVWSPLLKKYIAIATVAAPYAEPGTRVDIDIAVEWERHQIPATIVERPFFEPDRKKA
jgi:glycine cleavage system T protein (aminomethyltransferase)